MSTVMNIKPEIGQPKTGIEKATAVADALKASLADSQSVMFQSQACHWNAAGPIFHSIHLLTEEHYNDLFQAVDDIAERIRSLGSYAPMSLSEMLSLSDISEWEKEMTTGQMMSALIEAHEKAAHNMRSTVELAEEHKDQVSADLLIARIDFHEKASWMLKALTAEK